MIIALILELASIIVALLGLKCIKIGSATDQTKAKIAVTGGILSVLGGESAPALSFLCLGIAGVATAFLSVAGLCCLVAVSWYANRVVQDFYDPFNGGVKSVAAHAVSMILLANAF